jgi:single-strand DNA-binding protein
MANDINVVVLVGRLVRDCEVKVTAGGTSVCRFSVAINRRKKTGETWADEVNYFDVSLWGRSADTLKPYLTKGRQVSIEGELRQNRWEQDGQARSKVEIFANQVQLLSSPGTGADGTAPAKDYKAAAGAQPGPESFEDANDDVIPF